MWQQTQTRAPALFADVEGADDVDGYAAVCPAIMAAAKESDLNPFQRGVDVNLEYGEYLFVDPEALQAYYSETFLGALARCTEGPVAACDAAAPADVQVGALACYCHGLSVAAAEDDLDFEFYQGTVAKRRCSAFAPFDTVGTSVSVGAAVIVALVNAGLGTVILHLVAFERQRSHSAAQRSLFLKVLAAQYLNTSITPLIASAEVEWLSVVFGGVIFKHGFPDFTTNWCAPCHSVF